MTEVQLHITLETSPASDGWGFVGRVMVGDFESYRTIRAYTTPSEALEAAQTIVGAVLGALLAGEEWRSLSGELGHAAKREDLNFGLSAMKRRTESEPQPDLQADQPG